jgi:hypothetical protein
MRIKIMTRTLCFSGANSARPATVRLLSDFHREFQKLVGDEVEPVMPEELAKAIKDVPRDPEVINMLKNFSGAGPLPAR